MTTTRIPVDWRDVHAQAGLDYPSRIRLFRSATFDSWAVDAGDGVMRLIAAPVKVGDQTEQGQVSLVRVEGGNKDAHWVAETAPARPEL